MAEEKSELVNNLEGNSKEASWDYTRMVKDIVPLEFTEEQQPDGRWQRVEYFQGRRIIGRDTPIDKGVYMVAGTGEAIVVDSKKYPVLEEEYQKLLRKLLTQSKQTGHPVHTFALRQAYQTTAELLPYDLPGVEQLLRKMGVPEKSNTPQKVDLSVFVQNRVGVCRHQALLAGLFLEKLHDGGHLLGKPSVDRNWVPGQGGHAWVRYTNREGQIFIIDPAMKYIGSLSDVKTGTQWFYKRPEDK